MKNVCLKVGIIALVLALAFGVALIVLTVKREYAKQHYEAYHRDALFGCGRDSCKYCAGQTVKGSKFVSANSSNEGYYREFLYYNLITIFRNVSIGMTSACALTAAVTIPLHFKRAKTRRTDREDY